MCLLSIGVPFKNNNQWRQRGSEEVNIAWFNIFIEESLECLGKVLGWEFRIARLGTLHDLSKSGIQLLWHSCVKRREFSVKFTIWQLRIPKNLDQFFQCGCHNDLVVEAIED